MKHIKTIKLLWPFLFYKFAIGLSFITSITFFVYFQDNNIGYTNASLLLSMTTLLPIFFELITGVFADSFGRKKSVLVGTAIEIVMLALLINTTIFPVLLLVFAIRGVASTFISGAFDTWAIELIPDKQRDKMSEDYYALSASFYSVGMVIAGLLSSLLIGIYGQKSVWILRLSITMLIFVVLLFTHENYIKTNEHKNALHCFLENLKEGFGFFRNSKVVQRLIFGETFLVIGLFIVGYSAMQDFLLSAGLGSDKWGFIYTVAGALSVLVPFIAQFFASKFKHKSNYLALVIIVQIIIFSSSWFLFSPWLAALILLFYNLSEDLFNPISSALFQSKLSDKTRATLASLQSTILGIGYTFGMIAGGILSDMFGGVTTFIFAVPFLFISAWFYHEVENR